MKFHGILCYLSFLACLTIRQLRADTSANLAYSADEGPIRRIIKLPVDLVSGLLPSGSTSVNLNAERNASSTAKSSSTRTGVLNRSTASNPTNMNVTVVVPTSDPTVVQYNHTYVATNSTAIPTSSDLTTSVTISGEGIDTTLSSERTSEGTETTTKKTTSLSSVITINTNNLRGPTRAISSDNRLTEDEDNGHAASTSISLNRNLQNNFLHLHDDFRDEIIQGLVELASNIHETEKGFAILPSQIYPSYLIVDDIILPIEHPTLISENTTFFAIIDKEFH